MGNRDWEMWDRPGVAAEIEKSWQKEGEISYRKVLLNLVSKYIKGMDRFLEVGCGTGHIYRHLTEIIKVSYTGVDCSEEMLKIARALFPGGNFQKGDAYGLQFPDGSFDTVTAIDVL